MRSRRGPVVSILALVVVAGCGDVAGPGQNMLSVEFADSGLIATNRTTTPLYYVAVNPRAFIQWAPCVDPAECPRILPRATITIPFTEVLGWTGDPGAADVAVNFYRLIPAPGGGFRPDEVRQIMIRR